MTEEPIQGGRTQWLWLLLFIGMAGLIIVWLVNTWTVDSNVKQGASPEGVTFPANPGYEVQGRKDDAAGER